MSIGIYMPMDTGKIQGMQITASGKEKLIFLRECSHPFVLFPFFLYHSFIGINLTSFIIVINGTEPDPTNGTVRGYFYVPIG